MAFIERESVAASRKLAETRGSFPAFPGSIWDRPGIQGMRNATTTTIAPTGTLSLLAGTSSGIEPLFALAYRRRALDGEEWIEVHSLLLEALEREGLSRQEILETIMHTGRLPETREIPPGLRKLFITALEIPPEQHLAIQAAFQRHTHNAVSKTINLPENTSRETIARIFLRAYEMGLKGVTVYRYGARPEQVLKIPGAKPCPGCGDPLESGEYCVLCPRCGYSASTCG